jgi:hypothetical protein
MNLHFQIRFYRGDLFRRFLQEIWPDGTGHGSYLVQLLGSRQPGYESGMPDNGYAARRFLQLASEENWLIPGEVHPTTEQQFFGLGGSAYKYAAGKYGVDQYYRPNPQSKGLRFFVETGNVRIYKKDKEQGR